MQVTLLDPSLRDHQGNRSINLGDVIIYESIAKQLKAVFGDATIIRISTHAFLEKRHYDLIDKSDIVVIGGTNILSSDIRAYNQWKLSDQRDYYLFPKLKNIVLFGVGWWQYQNMPTEITKKYYEQVLSKQFIHSVRDNYTMTMLAKMGFKNVVNTSCPTTWNLNNLDPNRKIAGCNNCLFTLTDYSRNVASDSLLIKIILRNYDGLIYFYPQGTEDQSYLNTLEIFHANRQRITILDHSLESFDECIHNGNVNYIGTRLHSGTRCLENGIESLIVAVDNRAAEIGKDINLPVIRRDELYRVEDWINRKCIFEPIVLPVNDIEKWKRQFRP